MVVTEYLYCFTTYVATCSCLFCRQASINSFRYSFLLIVYFCGIVYPIRFCRFWVVILLNFSCIHSYLV